MSDESESYAARMIQRFRHGKPTSRAERIVAKQSGDLQEMWWIDNHVTESITGTNRSAPFSPSRQTRKYVDELDELFPQHIDNGISRGPKTPMNSSVDDIISKEIKKLEQEMNYRPESAFKYDYNPKSSNVKMSIDFKPRLAQSSSRYENADMRLSVGDILRTSASLETLPKTRLKTIETLGNTFFRGLMIPDLKLDGKVDKENVKEKGNSEIIDFKSNIEGGIKTTVEDIDRKGTNNINRDGNIRAIDVSSNLQSYMDTHIAHYNERHAREQAREKELQARDERLREEGELYFLQE